MEPANEVHMVDIKLSSFSYQIIIMEKSLSYNIKKLYLVDIRGLTYHEDRDMRMFPKNRLA